MIKILVALISLATLTAAAGFNEEGSDRTSCGQARKEAMFLAKSNCLSIGVESSQKVRFSKCRVSEGKRVVKVSYNCQLPKMEEDGYDPDYTESDDSKNL